MSLIIIEPSVKQHSHLYLRLVESKIGVDSYRRRGFYEANNKSLFKKAFSFDLLPLVLRSNNAYLFLASEFQHLLLFPILRLLGNEVLFVCHEPNLWFGGAGNYLRAVINLMLQWCASKVLVFDKKLADQHEKYQYVSLWNQVKSDLEFGTKKVVLSFGSETPNKNIKSLDFDWSVLGFELVRAGRTEYQFESTDIRMINSFVDDSKKDELYRKSSISRLPYSHIEQSMVLLEAMSYGHLVILNGQNTSWEKYHSLDFVFVYSNHPNEALIKVNGLTYEEFLVARRSSISFFNQVNGKEIFEILSNY